MKVTLEEFLVTGIAKKGDIIFLEISEERLKQDPDMVNRVYHVGESLGVSFVILPDDMKVSKSDLENRINNLESRLTTIEQLKKDVAKEWDSDKYCDELK